LDGFQNGVEDGTAREDARGSADAGCYGEGIEEKSNAG
jgi:hypothetical protein